MRLNPFAKSPEKKASVARPLIALTAPGKPVWTPRDYASLARAGFERNVVAYRCIRLVSEAAAATPLKVTENGAAQSEHPLLSLLKHPNPDQSGAELFEAFYGFLETAGNAYLEAGFVDGAARELYVLRPDRMKARLGARGWPEAYEYTVGGRTAVFPLSGDGPSAERRRALADPAFAALSSDQ